MKILHVTDFHFNKASFRWLKKHASKYDACCLTGDLLDIAMGEAPKGVSMLAQAKWVLGWLKKYAGPPLFICSGNHDGFFESHLGVVSPLARLGFFKAAAVANPSVLVDGTDRVLSGYRFICAGWNAIPPFIESKEPVVLLTHAGPDGTRVAGRIATGRHGLDVADLVEGLPPGSLVLSGHEHHPRAWRTTAATSACFNPGSGVGAAPPSPNRIIIEPERNFVTFETDASSDRCWMRLTPKHN